MFKPFVMKKMLQALLCVLPLLTIAQKPGTTRDLFDTKSIGEVRLTLTEKNWVQALDSMRIYGGGMLIGNAVVDGVKYEGAGVRFRGDKSYQTGLKRNPMTIQLDKTNASQAHQGYTSLKLSSALRDPSMVRERLFTEIARKYTSCPQSSYTKLYINDEYIGVFVNIESVDKKFLDKHFGTVNGTFVRVGTDHRQEVATTCRQGIYGSLEFEDNAECLKGNFDLISGRGLEDLQELTKILNTEPARIEKVLDVDRALWMLALNNVMVNLSSYIGNYSVNYYLYKDRNGRFQTIPWDLNLSFGSYKNTGAGSDLELKGLQSLDPLLHSDNPYKPLVSQLLKDPFYKKVYLSHVRKILEDNFYHGEYEKMAQDFQGSIAVAYNDDPNKPYTLDDLRRNLRETVGKRSKIPGITELMTKRAQFLKRHPELTALPSAISEVNVQGRARFENLKVNSFRISAKADRFPKRLLVYYRFSTKDAYTMVPMTEDDKVTNLPLSVKAFYATIEGNSPDAELEYYIVSENPGAAAFEPADYVKNPKRIKLSELNK
jgi:hypothetical protein